MVNAFGLFTMFDGPYLGRGTDRTVFRDSDINNRFQQCLRNAGMNVREYKNLGDKIYVDRQPCFLALIRSPLPGAEELFESIESVCRTSAEWSNGKLCENWKSITFQNHLPLQLSAVGRDVVVAALLTNCLTLVQGGQTLAFFRDPDNPGALEMPSLQAYFS
jgi:hypothetical protein